MLNLLLELLLEHVLVEICSPLWSLLDKLGFRLLNGRLINHKLGVRLALAHLFLSLLCNELLEMILSLFTDHSFHVVASHLHGFRIASDPSPLSLGLVHVALLIRVHFDHGRLGLRHGHFIRLSLLLSPSCWCQL